MGRQMSERYKRSTTSEKTAYKFLRGTRRPAVNAHRVTLGENLVEGSYALEVSAHGYETLPSGPIPIETQEARITLRKLGEDNS